MTEPFGDDPAWVRYKCLELAKDIEKYSSVDRVIETARRLNQFIAPTPKCEIFKLKDKDNDRR